MALSEGATSQRGAWHPLSRLVAANQVLESQYQSAIKGYKTCLWLETSSQDPEPLLHAERQG